MSITSPLFLFVFLPLALAIYYISNDNIKEYILLFISLIFYALGSVQYIVIFSLCIAFTVFIGRTINNYHSKILRKILLLIGISSNLLLLFYYKYYYIIGSTNILRTITTNTQDNILLPLGISFFTFKSISYLVDIYKGVAILDKNPIHDSLYLSIFTQIQAGPLSRYSGFLINRNGYSFSLFSEGVYRFIIGFIKKILLSNSLLKITTECFSTPVENLSTLYIWLGSICYSLQLFYDFSGYSDMAIGLSQMFGYQCMENFNYPYMTKSVSKFWRRWHISLGNWFRDYIYIPLGGSKNNFRIRTYINLLIVWIITGIWHGISDNFILWGLLYFIAIALEKFTKIPDRLHNKFIMNIYRVFVLLFINFQWVLFASSNALEALRRIKRMIIYTFNDLSNLHAIFLFKEYIFFIIISIIFCFPIVPKLDSVFQNKILLQSIYNILKSIIILAAFLWSISFVISGQNNPFAYANF